MLAPFRTTRDRARRAGRSLGGLTILEGPSEMQRLTISRRVLRE